MIRISLPGDDLQRPEDTPRETPDPELRHRARIVLMAHRGRRRPDIAADTGTPPRSAQRWLDAYLDRGLGGPRPREAPGARPKLTPDPAPVLRRRVIGGPAKRGPGRANWTYPGPADHPLRTRGVRVGKSALREFGAKHGGRPYRPAYRSPRGDPANQAAARGEVADLKKGRRPAASSRWAGTRPGSGWSRPSPRPSG